MLSRWYELKPSALKMRRSGKSIRKIESQLNIPRSTLSGWFKNIQLTKNKSARLQATSKLALIKARKLAVKWHKEQKALRIKDAENISSEILSKINLTDKSILELSLAMLYLGEGDKTQQTSMGSSNPLLLKFFINCLINIFKLNPNQIKCELHLRSDQDGKLMIIFWSKQLNLSPNNFSFVLDKRTAKTKTYLNYKGVCVVRCGNIAIQRRLVFLGQKYCKIVSQNKRILSSVG